MAKTTVWSVRMRRLCSALLALVLVCGMILSLSPVSYAAEDADEALDPKMEAALAWAMEAAENPRYGYSQWNRTGPNFDCSSFVSRALMEGGFELEYYLSTYTMTAELRELGFTLYYRGQVTPRRGDILLNPAKHVEFYMGNGACLAAHQDYDWRSGDSTGKEIQYRENGCSFCRWGNYSCILRYEGIDEPEEISEEELLALLLLEQDVTD